MVGDGSSEAVFPPKHAVTGWPEPTGWRESRRVYNAWLFESFCHVGGALDARCFCTMNRTSPCVLLIPVSGEEYVTRAKTFQVML